MKERGGAIYQLFLLALSIYVLVALVLESFVISNPEVRRVLQYVDFAICLVFLADFFVNLLTCKSKAEYLKWGWLDLVASIPAVDTLRWGRLSRVIRILRFLRSIKSSRVLLDAIQRSRFETVSTAVLLLTLVVYTVSAALIIEFEKPYESSIETADAALWWCAMNVVNAKIAITEAKSPGGIAVTVVLNKLGLLLFAYLNAILVAWLIQRRREGD